MSRRILTGTMQCGKCSRYFNDFSIRNQVVSGICGACLAGEAAKLGNNFAPGRGDIPVACLISLAKRPIAS